MKKTITKEYSIVRTYSAGVFAGNIVSRKGQEVVLANARRIWRWEGSSSLSQLAQSGTSKPENCKFPEAVDEITLLQVIEILKCTKAGEASIKSVPVWKS